MPTEATGEGTDFDRETFEALNALLGEERIEQHLSTFEAMLTDLYGNGADREALAKAAHKLRSVAGMLGFIRVSERAGELEEACGDAGDFDGALERIKEAGDAASSHVRRIKAG
ncbi:Hpt domain-containing protein [Methyloligella sp. 2.7D]|uniref:Hpt domain-containing protein n=1 Tax=unclassified Methyloligella TaxID=2625955 RepID=UPI00157E0DEC|nr:Hpt domain-containing protein [Methyloligella sp. GL2]QKP77180.1 Hpt domain-containing protein [Methyloligella sp. GL2]